MIKFNFSPLQIMKRFKYYVRIKILNFFFFNIFHKQNVKWMGDGFITSNFFGASVDNRFLQAVEKTELELKTKLYNIWRIYICVYFIKMLITRANKKYSISYVECGVADGITLLTSLNYFNLHKKYKKGFLNSKFLLMDTFRGVDLKYVPSNSISNNYKSTMYGNSSKKIIIKRFKDLNGLNIIEGSIPESLKLVNQKIKPDFLHLDMNNPYPEICALQYFYPKMKNGSIIIFDDYAFTGHNYNLQRKLINEYLDSSNINRPITLPTGQGILIK